MTRPKDPAAEPESTQSKARVSRRKFLKLGAAGATAAVGAASTAMAAASLDNPEFQDSWDDYFQNHYQLMSKEEVEEALARLERIAKRRWRTDVSVHDHPPIPGVLFGYALNISKCKGYRKCVYACVKENNITRHPPIHYIRVLEMHKGSMDLEESDHYYDPESVPRKGRFYLPVQCHHCENPPCVRACPTKATWQEPDGIVVIDYNWCIGCHYCVVACPYWARHFNWDHPSLPQDEINTETHYLGNRPRMRGVMEKCTFCIQRTRQGKLPACMEACPTGARVFGNLLDPNSELSMILRNKTVFRLKEDLNTDPKFWFYTD
jgi:molybdopterin-containing oxidoreductase family iron-sulfur binding subunit